MGITVAIVGLGFGDAFAPIWRSHPDVDRVIGVDPDARRRAEVVQRWGLDDSCETLDQALARPDVDLVHLLTPVPSHARLALQVLESGRHCAIAVPLATTVDDVTTLLRAAERTGQRLLMMETSVHGREYRTVADWYRAGRFGALTSYRGFHIQNLDGFPDYWQGFPPMHYLTHALSPILDLLGTRAVEVSARGSGRLPDHRRRGGFDNSFPSEIGHVVLDRSDLVAQVQMSFFQHARSYVEGFDLHGEHLGVEWPTDHTGPLTVHEMSGPAPGRRGNTVTTSTLEPDPDLGADRLPPALRPFTRDTTVELPGMSGPQSLHAGHGGSHPFLVAQAVTEVLSVDGSGSHLRAADLTLPGIVAHQSALQGGRPLPVPDPVTLI